MKTIYECIVGSHAYGTNIPTSDRDIKGIFIEPVDNILGMKYTEQLNIDKDTSFYEIKRFLQLAAKGNPTILEMLFIQDELVLKSSPEFNIVKSNRYKLLSKSAWGAFIGFAKQQLHRAHGLNKKVNWEKEQTIRKNPIDFCHIYCSSLFYRKCPVFKVSDFLKKENLKQEFCGLSAIDHMPNCYLLFYDHIADMTQNHTKGFSYHGISFEDSNSIRLSSIPKEQSEQHIGILYYNKDAYSSHCRQYKEYQEWLLNRNQNRYIGDDQKFDSKNLMHCIRLLNMGIELAVTGTMTVFRPEREYLIDIRTGKIPLQQILQEIEEKIIKLEQAFKTSDLQETVDPELLNELLIKIRKHT